MSVASKIRKSRSKPTATVKKTKTVSTKSTQKPRPEKVVQQNDAPRLGSSRLARIKTRALNRPPKIVRPGLPSAFRISKESASLIIANKKFFIGMTLLYALLTLIFVRGFSTNLDIPAAKEILQGTYSGATRSAATTVTIFGTLLTSSGLTSSSAQSAGFYQWLITIIISLGTLFGVRRIISSEDATVKSALYEGMYPLVPFLLLCVVVGVQLIPLALGSWIFSTVIIGGVVVTSIEKILFGLLTFVLVGWTLRMLSSSLFALFIVALPKMTPLRAARSAHSLVSGRRWVVSAKVLFLPLILFIASAAVMLPFIVFFPSIAEWVFLIFSSAAWLFVLTYMYLLYRELLNE